MQEGRKAGHGCILDTSVYPCIRRSGAAFIYADPSVGSALLLPVKIGLIRHPKEIRDERSPTAADTWIDSSVMNASMPGLAAFLHGSSPIDLHQWVSGTDSWFAGGTFAASAGSWKTGTARDVPTKRRPLDAPRAAARPWFAYTIWNCSAPMRLR